MCGRPNGRQHNRGGNPPIGNEGQIVERPIDGFDGVRACRLHSVDIGKRERVQEGYRCECCSFRQDHRSVLAHRAALTWVLGCIADLGQPRRKRKSRIGQVSTKTMTATETLGVLLPTITAAIRAITIAKTAVRATATVAS